MRADDKRVIVLLISVILAVYIAGCAAEKPQDDDQIKIGFMVDSLVIERWQKDRDIFVAKAKELGAEVVVKNANENAELQSKQVRELVDMGVDVIVIIPYDKEDIGQALKQAKRSGVKVISYDRLARYGDVDAYLSFDNIEVGRLMGNALVEKVPEGNYVIINGSPKDNNSFMFNEGYMSAISPKVTSGEIRIVKEIWAEDWREIYAYNAVAELINEGVEIDGIIGGNDDLAEGTIKALLERQLASQVIVVGHDGNLSACQRIVEGTQYVTIYKPIKTLAQKAAEIAWAMAIQGDAFDMSEQTDVLINDGERDVPYVSVTPYLVTKDNLAETVIKDGFHTKEEVYRNIPRDQWPED